MEHQTVEAQPDLYQTEDGVIFIQNPDGSIQVHGHSDQPIPLETVQALLAMESEGQIVEQWNGTVWYRLCVLDYQIVLVETLNMLWNY